MFFFLSVYKWSTVTVSTYFLQTTIAMATTTDIPFYISLFLIWLISSLLLRSFIRKHQNPNSTLNKPPTPPSLPIIGHLHLLSLPLPQSFRTLALRYGPLMKIDVGASTSLIVSNAAVAREVMKTHDLNFAYRPQFGAADYEIYKDSSFFGAGYGNYWRFLKKMCMTELLSPHQLGRFVDIRKQEVMKLFEILLKRSEEGEECDLGAELMTMTNNIICRMTMSTRCSASTGESKEIRDFIYEIMMCAAKMSLGEVWGPLKKFDLLGYGRKLKKSLLKYDKLVEGVMKEHEKEREGGERERKDMLDLLLGICEDGSAEVKLTRDNIKCFLLEIFMAGTETTGGALQWTIAEIINHPNVFKKLREEINAVVGPNRLVEESDIPNLPYLQAVVKEGLRLHPPSPLILRQCKEDCKINGYDVLANTRMMINIYAVMRDSDSWEDPNEFVPERFMVNSAEDHSQSQGEVKGHNLDYMPFGGGRRACPGTALALTVMHMTIGPLVQCFDLKVKGGGTVDMKEGSGVSASMANPLMCSPIVHINPFRITSTS